MAIAVLIEDDIDIGRGDMLVHPTNLPTIASSFNATLCWMSDVPMKKSIKYAFKHLTNNTRCIIKDVINIIDMHTITPHRGKDNLLLNEIAHVKIKTMTPLVFDSYRKK